MDTNETTPQASPALGFSVTKRRTLPRPCLPIRCAWYLLAGTALLVGALPGAVGLCCLTAFDFAAHKAEGGAP
jgi:hypothetical protein